MKREREMKSGRARKSAAYVVCDRDVDRCCYCLLPAIKMSSRVVQLCVHFAFICTPTHIYTHSTLAHTERNYLILFSTHYSTIRTEPERNRAAKAYDKSVSQHRNIGKGD